tara:strand:- start:96 stop:1142 length:1047 start_codon:yes stop_codon:yes gene_type:complete
MSSAIRRHDIDWLRVIAIGLLLLYHVSIGFQKWGTMIGFITNGESWDSLWKPMTMLNVWRIPLLFFVSGMGVYFAIRKRNWKQLLKERTIRILIPYIFGIFTIVPLQILFVQKFYHFEISYNANPSHLWFLGNIFAYVVIFLPVFFYIKGNGDKTFVVWIKKVFSNPFGLLIVIITFIFEAILVKPTIYELYAMTWHGFFLGLIAFFFGFCFVLSGTSFFNMILKWRWLFLSFAVLLYAYRLYEIRVPTFQIAIESNLWIFSVFAFGYKYLNHSSRILNYLSKAAYPIYIIHIFFLFLASFIIFPLTILVELKFLIVLLFTFIGSFTFYELIIRRIKYIRPLFGLKIK